jgi:hypothetical protein
LAWQRYQSGLLSHFKFSSFACNVANEQEDLQIALLLMNRMKLVQLQSRLWNSMLLLVEELSNTVKYREMRLRNFFRTLSRVLYQRKVVLHLASGMLK